MPANSRWDLIRRLRIKMSNFDLRREKWLFRRPEYHGRNGGQDTAWRTRAPSFQWLFRRPEYHGRNGGQDTAWRTRAPSFQWLFRRPEYHGRNGGQDTAWRTGPPSFQSQQGKSFLLFFCANPAFTC